MHVYNMYKVEFSLFTEWMLHTERALVYFWQESGLWPSVYFV
jgi:hypothetical protein